VGILWWKYADAKKDPGAANKATTARVLERVDLLYALPKDEEPTVAQVQDKSKLDNQEFFKKAANGDYLLIYQKNKLALIYREKDNKLINVGPVNIDNNQNKENQGQAETAGDQTQAQP
jgi:hypothetical protein